MLGVRDAPGPDPVGDFSVTVEPHRSYVVVAPSGELDLATADLLEAELADLRKVGFDDIILDLRQLRFIDSTGLHLLVSQMRAARGDESRFRLVEGGAAIRRLFDITGVRDVFEFTEGPQG